jgi:hypothetical protein
VELAQAWGTTVVQEKEGKGRGKGERGFRELLKKAGNEDVFIPEQSGLAYW